MAYAARLRSNTLSSRVIPDTWPANVVLILAGSALMAACARISFEFSSARCR